MPNLRFSLPIGIAAGCLAALALPSTAPAAAPEQTARPSVSPPARDPAALHGLLDRFDRMTPGAEREALALAIDRHAGQRYATVSRLYWYTDLDAAQAAAKASKRPILALRMLGRLDEDLSCANSRMFRTTLYSDAAVSKFLRDHFVLYWSSERPVPKVTIDYGDGRTLQGTTTGNSAHYVLDANGAVLDVLPGLYAPSVFTLELKKSLALAKQVSGLPPTETAIAVGRHHEQAARQVHETWQTVGGALFMPSRRRLLTQADVDSTLALAQRATFAKAYIEVPQLRSITAGADPGTIAPEDLAQWAAAGQKAWGFGGPITTSAAVALAVKEGADLGMAPYAGMRIEIAANRARGAAPAKAKPVAPKAPPPVLDARSRGLVTKLHTAGGLSATPAQLAIVIERLEHHIVADTALNQFKLRQQIRGYLARNAHQPLDALNAWIYASVFHTPSSDAWLGLLPRTDFTGLPGDGVSAP